MHRMRWRQLVAMPLAALLLAGCGGGGQKPGPRTQVHRGIGMTAAEEAAQLVDKGARLLVFHYPIDVHESFQAQVDGLLSRARKLDLKPTAVEVEVSQAPVPSISVEDFQRGLEKLPEPDAIITLGGSLPIDAADLLQGREVAVVAFGANSRTEAGRARRGLCDAAIVPVDRYDHDGRIPGDPMKAFRLLYQVVRFDDEGNPR